jgi:hypothetical protein
MSDGVLLAAVTFLFLYLFFREYKRIRFDDKEENPSALNRLFRTFGIFLLVFTVLRIGLYYLLRSFAQGDEGMWIYTALCSFVALLCAHVYNARARASAETVRAT